ncbi:hypothetical protein [Nocardioides sp. LHG3406-4]|uniref:hypothetical protein n=1 Tax=Nocardioides sp. LHG3406-4 TaxID=2804575 RepID=UPI003CEAA0DA
MTPRRTAGLCCLLGGALWVVRRLVAPSASDLLQYAGLALLAAGLAVGGAGLVKRGTWWLRLVAGLGTAALAWSVVEVVRPAGGASTVDAVAGALALVAGLVAVLTGGARTDRRPVGAHLR